MTYTAVVVRSTPMTVVLVGPNGMSLGGLLSEQPAERLARRHLRDVGVPDCATAAVEGSARGTAVWRRRPVGAACSGLELGHHRPIPRPRSRSWPGAW